MVKSLTMPDISLCCEIDITIKLLLACALGGTIGFLREWHGKAAGFRTHMMVCMGSALFTIVSLFLAMQFNGVDAARVASGVVMGVGFLGGGAIIREGGAVRGLTTAASVWTVAAIGLAVGSGMYFASVAATVLTLIILHILSIVERKYISHHQG